MCESPPLSGREGGTNLLSHSQREFPVKADLVHLVHLSTDMIHVSHSHTHLELKPLAESSHIGHNSSNTCDLVMYLVSCDPKASSCD